MSATGSLQWYAGTDEDPGLSADGTGGRHARLHGVYGLTWSPDGSIYLADNAPDASRLRHLTQAFGESIVPSADGAALFEFDLDGRHLRTVDALTGVALYTFEYDAEDRLVTVVDCDGLETVIERNGSGVATAIVSPFGVRTELVIDGAGNLVTVTDAEGHEVHFTYQAGGLLTGLEDANGGEHTYQYDASGRLLHDENPAGGAQTLSRQESENGWTATRAQLDAGTSTYLTEQLGNGSQRRTQTAPDGTVSVSLETGDDTMTMTAPDGTVTTSTQAPDPRFGQAAPMTTGTVITTPLGLEMTLERSRAVVLDDPENPFSAVVSSTDTTTVNGRTAQTVFDGAARTITSTSPEGRQTVTTLDTSGRPVSVQAGTLTPTTFVYDAQGRVASSTQGTRTTTFTYDANGYVGEVTDPLARTVAFTNDAIGRTTAQTFPDERVASFAYDNNGNLTSLTPPGKPAHTLAYTPVDQLQQYTAPTVGGITPTTQYQFNLATQPTLVTRADGQQIEFTYDTAGRLTELETPTGSTTYAYDGTTGQLTTLTAPAATLTYAYDGGLQTSETIAGVVAGVVEWDYDHDFRVVTERVLGGNAATYAYDDDGLMTQAGAVTYTRDTANGLLTGATIGGTTSAFTHNSFGELASQSTTYSAATLYSGAYTRDAGGRLATNTELIGGTTTVDAYTYDLAGRLTVVARGGATLAEYAYDPNGNRTSVTTSAGTTSATYDAQDRILTFGARTYTHTAHGEVASWTEAGATTTLTYDMQGNLLQVALPSSATVSTSSTAATAASAG